MYREEHGDAWVNYGQRGSESKSSGPVSVRGSVVPNSALIPLQTRTYAYTLRLDMYVMVMFTYIYIWGYSPGAAAGRRVVSVSLAELHWAELRSRV